MQPIFCMIIPLSGSGNYPDNSLPGQPPYPSTGPGFPTNPIAPGGRPPGIWGGAPTYPDIGFPGQQPGVSHPIAPGGQPPYPSTGPGFPTHPIAPGGRPPGIWGGAPTYPDIGGPGPQPTPTPPIYFPPSGGGGSGEGIWGGKPPEWIDNTLPELPPEAPDVGPIDWKAGWTAQTGWVIVGVPQVPAPTPSK